MRIDESNYIPTSTNTNTNTNIQTSKNLSASATYSTKLPSEESTEKIKNVAVPGFSEDTQESNGLPLLKGINYDDFQALPKDGDLEAMMQALLDDNADIKADNSEIKAEKSDIKADNSEIKADNTNIETANSQEERCVFEINPEVKAKCAIGENVKVVEGKASQILKKEILVDVRAIENLALAKKSEKMAKKSENVAKKSENVAKKSESVTKISENKEVFKKMDVASMQEHKIKSHAGDLTKMMKKPEVALGGEFDIVKRTMNSTSHEPGKTVSHTAKETTVVEIRQPNKGAPPNTKPTVHMTITRTEFNKNKVEWEKLPHGTLININGQMLALTKVNIIEEEHEAIYEKAITEHYESMGITLKAPVPVQLNTVNVASDKNDKDDDKVKKGQKQVNGSQVKQNVIQNDKPYKKQLEDEKSDADENLEIATNTKETLGAILKGGEILVKQDEKNIETTNNLKEKHDKQRVEIKEEKDLREQNEENRDDDKKTGFPPEIGS
jgi:hypothetical protein